MPNKCRLVQLIVLYVALSSLLFGLWLPTPSRGEDVYTRTIRFMANTGPSTIKQVEVSYSIPYSKFQYYYNAPHPWSVEGWKTHLSYYVVIDSVVSGLADTLRSMATGDEEDVANTVLSFVQNVGYENTSYNLAKTLYPIETLVLGGVCDDLSVLYATLMCSLGYRLIFVFYQHTPSGSHISVAVHLVSSSLHYPASEYVYFDVNGTRYYYADPASSGRIGFPSWLPEGPRFEQVVAYSHFHKYPTAISCGSNLTGFGELNLTAELGRSVEIRGGIDSSYKVPLNSSVLVRLTFIFLGEVNLTKTVETGSTWRVTLTEAPEKIGDDLPTDQYKVLFIPDRPGRWFTYASWEGNDQMEGATSNPICFIITSPTPTPTPTPTSSPTPSVGRCLIATATYGSELSPEVQFLREFRDQEVMSTFAGRQFMIAFNTFYYSFSPAIAQVVIEHPAVKSMVRLALCPLLTILHLSAMIFSTLSPVPEFAILMSGIVASSLIGLVYVFPIALALYLSLKKLLQSILKFVHKEVIGSIWILTLTVFLVGEIRQLSELTSLATVAIVLLTISNVTLMVLKALEQYLPRLGWKKTSSSQVRLRNDAVNQSIN